MLMRALAMMLAVLGAGAVEARPDCAGLVRFAMPGTRLRIVTAAPVAPAPPGSVRASPAGPPLDVAVPGWCRVDGIIGERAGADGRRYGIGFALALPDDWNGRFLYQGGGGLNGTVNPPLGAAAAGATPALARGFAVLATDGGHRGAVFDRSFMTDQRALLDFAQDSVGTAAPVAKALIAAYYGRPAVRAYFVGCSTGGREAMLSAERYPEMFDGIVAGAPAMRTGNSNLGLLHAQAVFNRLAPRDAAGLPQPTRLFPPADKALILAGLLDQCDGLDGLKDGVIANPTACHFRPAALRCVGAKQPNCLDAAQVQALEEAFQPPRDAAGDPLYAAYPYDTGLGADGPGIPGFLPSASPSPLGPPTQATAIDFDAKAREVRADWGQTLTDTDRWTNLSGFVSHGGRMIFYHGMSDPWFSPWDTLGFVARAAAATPGWDAAHRVYLVPGMGHCGGGANTFDRFDLLGAMVAWVEEGRAPAAVEAGRTGPEPASRPLCPFPSYPAYAGSGDPRRAAAFACRVAPGGPNGSTSVRHSG